MNTKLKHVQNWPELAKRANWSASVLAKQCGVSERTLRRHFLKQMGECPREWLAGQRQDKAIELLRDGSSVKEAAAGSGYKQQTNFTRKFKSEWGACPTLQPPLLTDGISQMSADD
jgi:AraC-like DNA-binding protein